MDKVEIEVCVDSLASCFEAIKGGASRLELCSALFLGGLTPSYGMMKSVRDKMPHTFPVNVMIRPREGDFLYSRDELDMMKHDIQAAKDLGYHGVVFGALTADGRIDIAVTKELVEYSLPMSVTFHRAIGTVLTSGLESSVMEGIDTIKDMISMASQNGGGLIVMPGGGVTERNINKIVTILGIKEIHLSGRVKQESGMTFRNGRVFMGGEMRASEFTLSIVSQNKIQSFLGAANGTN
eukprot:gene13296-15628_t